MRRSRIRRGAANTYIVSAPWLGRAMTAYKRTMILALAIRHRMERPAMSMEGGATPMEQFATAVCLTYEKNNIYSGGSSMDKQIEESEPKKQEEILSFGGVAISVRYAEQDDPHITEALKRSVFSYGFYNNSYKT